MRSLRSKEDDVQKISSSVFVTNFPKQFSAKDLWNTHKVYGHVVDTYIPDRRSKIGKRSGFVRFINVFDMERLVNNLCTVWIGKLKLHANVARYQRVSGKNNYQSLANSYANVVKKPTGMNETIDGTPTMVLDESVPGWVLDFEDDCDDDDFESNDGTQVVEGPEESVGKCSDLEGKSDSEAIPETRFEDEPMDKFDDINSIPHSKPQSEDPFGVYELLNKKKKVTNNEGESQNSPTYPSKFTPNDNAEGNNNTFNVEPVERGHNGDKEEGENMLIISIYAPQELSEKRTLWDYLCFTICNWDGDVVTMGDFNEVRDSSERFGSVFNKHGAKLFNDFIANAGLTEVPLGGCIFTWCHKTASKMSKLNRFLVSDSLLCNCPHISSVTLDRYLSDHRPILLRESIYDYGPIPFKFYHYWFEIDGFDKLVEDSWNEIHVVDNNAYAVDLEREVSIEEVKRAVWDFGCEWFFLHERIPSRGNSSFITLIPKVSNANMVKDFRPISLIGSVYKIGAKILANCLVLVLGDLVSDIQYAFLKERQILDGPFILNEVIQWCKKNKKQSMIFKVDFEKAYESVRWDFVDTILKKFGFGDKWCKWIYSCLQSSRSLILINGQWNQSNIDTIVRVLKVFHSASGLRINMKKSKIIGIAVDTFRVEQAIRQIGCMALKMPFKYLGLVVGDRMSRVKSWNDVIDTLAIDLEWEVSKEEIKRAVWDCGIDKAPGNSSFIILIPKVSNANMVKDFRPISLIGSVYKIVSKILANRLVLVLGDLVSDIQSAFLKKRQILDDPFILNEVIQWCKKKKKQSMIFKVDFKKAYDSVRWDFVDTILKKFGFGDKWCKWIHSCLQSSRGSILSNGSPTPEFQFFKGLKQGDSLSPFLFILVMDYLHLSFQRVNQSNIDTIVRMLKVFHSASGLRINMKKSKLIGIVMDASRVEQAIRQIGCMALKMPFKYLGSVVGDRMSRVKSWNDVIYTLIQMTILKEILEGCILSDTKDRWTWSLEGSRDFSFSSIRKIIDAAFLPYGNVRTQWVKEVPIKINILAWKVSNDYLPTRFNLSRRAHVQDFEVVGFEISGD
nr:RNA-directed DNA polymerase, eukaryota, reverse transcriptase zinc-binding domain protein [Tanacetum cinerariifolium]